MARRAGQTDRMTATCRTILLPLARHCQIRSQRQRWKFTCGRWTTRIASLHPAQRATSPHHRQPKSISREWRGGEIINCVTSARLNSSCQQLTPGSRLGDCSTGGLGSGKIEFFADCQTPTHLKHWQIGRSSITVLPACFPSPAVLLHSN